MQALVPVALDATAPTTRGRTLFEKIIERHALAAPGLAAPSAVGQGGFVRADLRFIHEYYTAMAAHLLQQQFGDTLALHDRASIVCFEDHLSYLHRSPVHVGQGLVAEVQGLSRGHRQFVARHGLKDHGYLQALEAGDSGNTGSHGISHALVAEQYALPGQLIVGTDSHTPHSGALGCVAFGVGTTDMANAFVTGALRFTLPAVLRIEVTGRLPAGVGAKDLALHLLARPDIRAGLGVGKVFEFGGEALRAMATAVRDHCIARGQLAAFDAVGAELLQPACGACANCGPGALTSSDQVTVSAINRNFPGRSGPGQVWLASQTTVAASAIAGELVSFEALRQRFNGA